MSAQEGVQKGEIDVNAQVSALDHKNPMNEKDRRFFNLLDSV